MGKTGFTVGLRFLVSLAVRLKQDVTDALISMAKQAGNVDPDVSPPGWVLEWDLTGIGMGPNWYWNGTGHNDSLVSV